MGMNVTEKHRKVSLDVIIVGPNKRGTPQSRLIVPEENNRELVKEYTKKKDIYYCVACNRQGKFNYGKIEYNWFLTPTFHYSWCLPTSRIEAERKNFIKQSKMPGVCFARNINNGIRKQNKLSPAAKLNSAILGDSCFTEETTVKNGKRRRSPSVEYLSTVISPCKKHNVELEVRQNISNNPELENFHEAVSRLTEDALPDPIQKSIFARNTVEPIPSPTIDVQNDVHVLQHESVKQCDCFDFNHPSKFWLKSACKKLNINYDQNAYKFWSNINIDEIKDVSKPDYIRSVKGGKNSCFRALSYLLSGVENKEIKTTIRTYFYDNFKDLGVIAEYDFATLTINDKIVKDTILAEQMTPILWETIAKYLECRIGIFEDDKLAKYGNWIKNDEEIVTLLFEKDNENYRIVMELSDI